MRKLIGNFRVITNPNPPARNIADEQRVMMDFINNFPNTWAIIRAFMGEDGQKTLINVTPNPRVSVLAISFLPKIGDDDYGPAYKNMIVHIRGDASLKVITDIRSKETDRLVFGFDLTEFDWQVLKWQDESVAEFNDDVSAAKHIDDIFWYTLPNTYELKKARSEQQGLTVPRLG